MKSIRLLHLLATATLALGVSVVHAQATPGPCTGVGDLADEVECSIIEGLDYLASIQQPFGAVIDIDPTAATGLYCAKLFDRARELGQDPFTPEDPVLFPYAGNLERAITWLAVQIISGDPGELRTTSGNRSYTVGIAAMCFASSNAPEREVETGAGPLTYGEIVNGLVNWLNNNQQKDGCGIGGWYYREKEDSPSWGDNSISGYATHGLGYAAASPPEGFGIPVPISTQNALDQFVGSGDGVQRSGGDFDGGSGYMRSGCSPYSQSWINALKTGNLLYELGLIGEGPGDSRVDRAVDFLVRYWDDTAGQYDGGGWIGDPQAMFTMMKGLEGLGIDILPAGDPNDPDDDIDWFADVARYLVDDQNDDGSWSAGGTAPRGGLALNTAWALLTLEKAVPQIVTEIPVPVDIKPGSCPNAFQVKQKGVTPMAVVGTEDVPVDMIDPSTIRLTRLDENGDPVVDESGNPILLEPLRWSYEDVATPYEGELCGCHELMGDGIMDLSLKFSSPEMVARLGLSEDDDKAFVELTIVGNLFDDEPDVLGTPIKGSDCLRLNNKRK